MQLTMLKNKNLYFWLLLALLILAPVVSVYADGSRNFYPSASTPGVRAILRSSTTSTENWPFPNNGTHYVYAEAGETITLASSAQDGGSARIRMYNPSNTMVVDNTSSGQISNRTSELAGPRLQGQTGGNYYTPIYYTVPAGGTGIYRVNFHARGTGNPGSTISAGATSWSQQNNAGIVAWDVSVIKNGTFVPGRVYTNVLNLSVGTSSPWTQGFHGLVYVRTNDGYTYRVNNNGNNGMLFTFFVNNNGFLDNMTDRNPLYRSLNTTTNISDQVFNPNNADDAASITHKLFYTLPADDLPPSASIALTSNGGSSYTLGTTWLKNEVVTPVIENIKVVGADGTENQVSNKGGKIVFDTNVLGNYLITLKLDQGGVITTQTLSVAATVIGTNTAYWNGKDGNGNFLAAGTVTLGTTVQLMDAEVHFPFMDMEYNIDGTIIELLDKNNLNSVKSDLVYWNDDGITQPGGIKGALSNPLNNSHLSPIFSSGISSNSNGHKWGLGATGNSANVNTLGDKKSIDTWTFIVGESTDVENEVKVMVADLKVTSITADNTSPAIGSDVTYTIKVKNGEEGDGGSDVKGAPFTFTLPDGFEASSVTPVFTGNDCGTESEEIEYDAATRTYSSKLDLPNGCEVAYVITTTVTSSATQGSTRIAEVAILRPADVTDPNATNRSDPENPLAPESAYPKPNVDTYYVPPFSAEYECSNREANVTEACNNIATATVTISTNSTFAIDDFIETDPNTPVSGNVLDNDYDLEGHIQTITSTGSQATSKGGTIVINADGTYTYTPPTDFSGLDYIDYTVCDNGSPQACATARLTIGVGICTVEVAGQEFDLSGGAPQTFNQPASDYGFSIDIYKLDNSFNMTINGTPIAIYEIDFQTADNPNFGANVQFSDGGKYEAGGIQAIWQMAGDALNPLIRVVISPAGSVSLYGSKKSGGPLYPLVLTENNEGVNRFNKIVWNNDGDNVIILSQRVIGVTEIKGYGYGKTMTPCVNYWIGGTTDKINEWREPNNWTYNMVPDEGQDVIFATEQNNPTNANNPKSGPAREDLHLDDLNQSSTGGRVIGDLINASNKDLIITTGNQLTINGTVIDNNSIVGTIVVKSTNVTTNENEPTGTLIVNPDENPDGVQAIVEFYNQAYDCEECGFYTRSWQYFGIPVEESGATAAPLPFTSVEEVNEWSEPANGDKWITPNMPLTAFTGYEITRNQTTEPDYDNAVNRFEGLLNISSVTVGITRTTAVNYPGANLVGNSYTAAIPISSDALTFPTGVEETVYLFNTGTRDQWRKLNGTAISRDGYRSGQYLAVPVNLGGQDEFPDRIPSMHAFMVLAESGNGGNLGIDYSKLVKNTTVNRGNGEQIVTRSTNDKGSTTAKSTIPSLVMDVIGEESADRVWIFTKEGTTCGFENGWDGRKMSESGITQLYVEDDAGKEHFQVATVPGLENLSLGFTADMDGKYTLEFGLSDHWTTEDIYLNDLATGIQTRVKNGGSYTFEAKKGDSGTRFSLSASGGIPADDEAAKITVTAIDDGNISINNNSSQNCSVSVSNTAGKLLQRLEVEAGNEEVIENPGAGTYVVRLQNAVVNDARKIMIK